MPRVLLIDNYDSFTFNLVQLLAGVGADVRVVRNDEIDLEGIQRSDATHVVISPGPYTPREAGVSLAAVEAVRVPLLGVCLGHQAIGEAFGGRVVRAPRPVHGQASAVVHEGKGLFAGLPSPFDAARYHSLVVEQATLPDTLIVDARTRDGLVMAVRHRTRPVFGVQFHPESILSQCGEALVRAFLAETTPPPVQHRQSMIA